MMNVKFFLDQTVVEAGSILSGKLVLSPDAGSAKEPIKEVNLVFEGTEESQVTYEVFSNDHHSSQKVIQTANEKQIIYSQLLVRKEFHKGEPVTTRSIPFRFELPVHLPSSVALGMPGMKVKFLFAKRQADYAVLGYRLRVTVKRPGVFKRNLTFEETVDVIKARDTWTRTPWQKVPQVDPKPPKKSLCCGGGGGEIFLAARLPTGTQVEMGQALPVDVSVINDSPLAIDHVQVSLVQYECWKAKRHKKKCNYEVASKSFGWLGDTVMNPDKQSPSVGNNRKSYEKWMRAELIQADHRQTLTVPFSCSESFEGNLMNTRHELRIKVKATRWFGNPEIRVPISVHPCHDLASASTNPPPIAPEAAPIIQKPTAPVEAPKTTVAIANSLPTTASPTPSRPVVRQQPPGNLPSFIQAQVGSPKVWEGAPVPQATGLTAFFAKRLLRSMGVDPYAQPRTAPAGQEYEYPVSPKPTAEDGTPIAVNAIPISEGSVKVEVLVTQIAAAQDPVQRANELWQASPAWRNLMGRLSPLEFGSVIAAVQQDFRQAPLAEFLAPIITPFSCQHLVEALHSAISGGVRNRMLATLPRCCKDIHENKKRVKAELNELERAYFNFGLRNPVRV